MFYSSCDSGSIFFQIYPVPACSHFLTLVCIPTWRILPPNSSHKGPKTLRCKLRREGTSCIVGSSIFIASLESFVYLSLKTLAGRAVCRMPYVPSITSRPQSVGVFQSRLSTMSSQAFSLLLPVHDQGIKPYPRLLHVFIMVRWSALQPRLFLPSL